MWMSALDCSNSFTAVSIYSSNTTLAFKDCIRPLLALICFVGQVTKIPVTSSMSWFFLITPAAVNVTSFLDFCTLTLQLAVAAVHLELCDQPKSWLLHLRDHLPPHLPLHIISPQTDQWLILDLPQRQERELKRCLWKRTTLQDDFWPPFWHVCRAPT